MTSISVNSRKQPKACPKHFFENSHPPSSKWCHNFVHRQQCCLFTLIGSKRLHYLQHCNWLRNIEAVHPHDQWSSPHPGWTTTWFIFCQQQGTGWPASQDLTAWSLVTQDGFFAVTSFCQTSQCVGQWVQPVSKASNGKVHWLGKWWIPLLSFRVAQAVFADERRRAVEEC